MPSMPFYAGPHCLAAFPAGFQGRVLGMGDVNKHRVATCLLPRESLASGRVSMGCQWPCCCSSGFSDRRALKVNGRGTDCMSTCTFSLYADLGPKYFVDTSFIFFHFLIFSCTLIGIPIAPSFAQIPFEATGSWNYE